MTALPRVIVLFVLGFACLPVPAQAPAKPERATLRALLESGSFARLDAEMSAYQDAYRNGVISDDAASKVFIALKENNPDLRPAYDKWVAEHPTSYVARLARGYFLMSLGYLARGSEYAALTPNARFRDMEALFDEAMTDLEASLGLDGRPALSYGPMISIARGRGARDRAKEFLDRAIALDPAVYTARISYLDALRPEWGGSLEEMAEFVAASRDSISQEHFERLERVLADAERRAELEPAARLIEQGQYEEAIKAYDSALERGPSARAFAMRGYAHSRLERHDLAIADYTRALEIDPEGECCSGTRASRAHSYLASGDVARGTADLLLAAEDDDHWAARELAVMYAFGKYGTKVDYGRARRWCERAAKQGDGLAMYCMGGLHHAGLGVERNAAAAAKWFELAAERGIADAQADIGFMYRQGEGVPSSLPRALYWWALAALQGNERAITQLAPFAAIPVVVLLLAGLLVLRYLRR